MSEPRDDLIQSLRRSEERFRAIFEHSNDAIFLVDVEQDAILDVNGKACRMLGYSIEELRDIPMSVIHPQEMEKVRAFAQSVFATGSGFTDELSCLTKSGALLDAEISASVVEIGGRRCMIASIHDATQRNRLAVAKEQLDGELADIRAFGPIIGDSPEIQAVLEQIGLVAPTDASVLVTGESGTGKELVARAIHAGSARRSQPLVAVNCASIPAELFESEFFGHVRGAFTTALKDRPGRFELADGGTIFLDEIGEIPVQLQSKLLRVLQLGEFERVGDSRTRKVDVRVVAASNRDLVAACSDGRFREDLYYRLSVFPIRMPSLREHPGDIPALAKRCVRDVCKRLGRPPLGLGPDQLGALQAYSWPGNVRELQNVIERAVILAREGELVFDIRRREKEAAGTGGETPAATLGDVEQMERRIIVRALEDARWKIYGENGAAAHLNIKPSTLAYRIKRMGITRDAGGSQESGTSPRS